MKTLTVSDFSCIQKARLEIEQLTIIIGPQASGKSVLCKLAYFLIDCAQLQHTSISRKENFERFIDDLKLRFLEWFPIAAWGNKRFKIQFEAGDYCVELARKTYGGKVSDDFRVKFSTGFKERYELLLSDVQKVSQKVGVSAMRRTIEFDWELRETVAKSLKTLMGKDCVSNQAFVPAGRSFFTSIGKAIAAFEQGRVLDPLILRFGHLYTAYKEHRQYFFGEEKSSEIAKRKAIEQAFGELLGGRVERDGEKEFVHTDDGRKVPFSALSSGQQELLPLVAFLPWLYGGGADRLCYIEEPEAHLFPSAQSKLIESLVSAGNSSNIAASLVLTTHSPYVLTKVNNLLKAGSISKKIGEPKRKELDAIISRRAWVFSNKVRAYAIKDGKLFSILDSDGLIDADYLDTVSGDMGTEFSRLLQLEEAIG
jgi:energy-coupling factor transporter ATP-binding protein EcfA2